MNKVDDRLAFLWREHGIWRAQLPHGPAGSGATQEESIAALREAMHELRLAIENRTPPPEEDEHFVGLLRSTMSTENLDPSRTEEIDRFDLDDCLLISPHAFTALLDEQCTRLTDRELRRSLELRRLLGREGPRPVCSISNHPVGAWLRRHRILSIASELYDLRGSSLWGPFRFGTFAFDGANLVHFDGSVGRLQTVLQAEQPLVDDIDPARIAEFVVATVRHRREDDHTLATIESLERMEDSGQCLLDRRELARISPLPEPMLEANEHGWILRFATTEGGPGIQNEVYEWRIELSRRFEVQVRLDLLSSRIFESWPIVME
ncbi:hypothetical protein K2X89_16550 [Myxococcota bacterium]|nr:hypothetical protein [Myxococcota bacterium]